jgi:hypothetical protein
VACVDSFVGNSTPQRARCWGFAEWADDDY